MAANTEHIPAPINGYGYWPADVGFVVTSFVLLKILASPLRTNSSPARLREVALAIPALLACAWLHLASSTVPEPYLDEVFHIPQAQRYCEGRYAEWDDKITTPPGLYILSAVLDRLRRPNLLRVWQDRLTNCSTARLRSVNTVALLVVTILAATCRQEIESWWLRGRSPRRGGPGDRRNVAISTYALHTGVNIGLFPVLFFFSALYYTDVASTTAVLACFCHQLRRLQMDRTSWGSDILAVLLAIVALTMRQTNVFWVVVYMGGLEAVQAIRVLASRDGDKDKGHTVASISGSASGSAGTSASAGNSATVWGHFQTILKHASVGRVHDPLLAEAHGSDMIFCTLSLAAAVFCNPIPILRRVWPHITVLSLFATFVSWNGGVVLGDRSNHVATIHLAQMLYLGPFFAFVSAPLLIPAVLFALFKLYNRLSDSNTGVTSLKSPAVFADVKAEKSSLRVVKAGKSAWFQPPFPSRAAFAIIDAALLFAIVKFNTIIHPFTLADNRHYTFYAFRYTIRRAWWIRYTLIPPYMLCQRLVWHSLCAVPGLAQAGGPISSRYGEISAERSDENAPPLVSSAGDTPHSGDKKSLASTSTPPPPPPLGNIGHSATTADITATATVSTGILLVLTTALSLVTAPLVEPRYYIIPWVMWRLLVPARQSSGLLVGPQEAAGPTRLLLSGVVEKKLGRIHDPRLLAETAWHLAVNLVTVYMFLRWPYQWKDENGTVLDGGKVQRFMW